MSLFKWSNAHSVYIPELDAEHRDIFRLGEELHQALEAGATRARLKPLVEGLLQCMNLHFRHEERMMFDIRYQALNWHKHQHDAARKTCRALVKSIAEGDREGAGQKLESLAGWLGDHLRVADRMMGARLRNYLRFSTSLAS